MWIQCTSRPRTSQITLAACRTDVRSGRSTYVSRSGMRTSLQHTDTSTPPRARHKDSKSEESQNCLKQQPMGSPFLSAPCEVRAPCGIGILLPLIGQCLRAFALLDSLGSLCLLRGVPKTRVVCPLFPYTAQGELLGRLSQSLQQASQHSPLRMARRVKLERFSKGIFIPCNVVLGSSGADGEDATTKSYQHG